MTTHVEDTPLRSSWAQQAQEEQRRSEASTRKARTRGALRTNSTVLADRSVVAILLIAAALTHGPVFGDWHGYAAALGGIMVGAAVAWAAWRGRLGWLTSAMTLFLAYILCGGLIALPQTALYGVLPTVRTLQTLVVGIVGSWKDLLTVQPPAGVFIGPTVMPYLSATLCTFVAVTILLRTRRPLWALLPIMLLMVTGILWGSQNAPLALIIGPLIAVTSLIWASLVVARRRSVETHGTVTFEGKGHRATTGRWVASLTMIAIGVIAAVVVNLTVGADAQRTVLRDYVEPPLDLREYHSPVAMFRHWNTTEKDTKLLTVAGAHEGARIRLATLDYYDGTVFQVVGNQAAAGFRHVGRSFTDTPLAEGAQTQTLSVTIGDYLGHWVPGVAQTRTLEYTGNNAPDLADSLYYSDLHETGLSTLKLTQGDTYHVENVTMREWNDDQLSGKPIATHGLIHDHNVPQAIGEKAAAMVAEAEPGLGQVRAIEQALHTKGFYSDGSDGLSLPGHRADRLERFVTANQMIGDDDQYAPTMALMLRSLGIPSRVVMGFYTDTYTGGDMTLTGKDTHLWVEVPFEGAGWVPFFPTPPRDQVPQTEVPKPKPNPTPQVLQPPEPPEEPAEAPLEVVEEPEDDTEEPSNLWPWLILAAQIAGGTLLVLSPWLLLLALKARRRKRRRTKGRHDMRAAGAWDELIDRATDLGVTVTTDATRREQARHIDASLEGRDTPGPVGFQRFDEERTPLEDFALLLDGAVFSANMPNEDTCTAVWASSKNAVKSIKTRVPWYRRVRAIFSSRSLRARRTPMRTRIAQMVARAHRTRPSQLIDIQQFGSSRRKPRG